MVDVDFTIRLLWLVLPTVAVICLAFEWLHARRCLRVGHLAFAEQRGGIAAVFAAAGLRTVAVVTLCAGLIILLFGAKPKAFGPDQAPPKAKHHLVIALDVSPSMTLKDSGKAGTVTRGDRAREVIRSIIERLDTIETRISMIAFYTEAKPVIVDTFDPEVVNNVLDDLPLEHAFMPGKTDLYEGVRVAAALAEGWAPKSATILVVGDGDTLPADDMPELPDAVASMAVLGVGNPHRGTFIDGHASRQDRTSLNLLATRLRGQYHDVNEKHLSTEALMQLAGQVTFKDAGQSSMRQWGLILVAAGGITIALISPILAVFGIALNFRRSRRPARRAKNFAATAA